MKLRFADVLSTPDERRASQLTRICAAAYTDGMARGSVPNLSPDRRSELTCLFSALRNSERIVLRNELAFALRDATPGSDLHTWYCHFGMRGLTSTSPQKDLRRRLTCWAAGRATIPSGSFRGRFHRGQRRPRVRRHDLPLPHRPIPRRKGDVDNALAVFHGVIPDIMRY
jgi:hypothetical protein